MNFGYWALKNCVQESTRAVVESYAVTVGNPMLQVGGEQAAVTVPEPGDGVERAQDSWHPVATDNTPGCDALQTRGILLRTMPPFVLGRELLPITSVRTAVAVSEAPLEATKVVWPDCCAPALPSSRERLWILQVSKKSRAG